VSVRNVEFRIVKAEFRILEFPFGSKIEYYHDCKKDGLCTVKNRMAFETPFAPVESLSVFIFNFTTDDVASHVRKEDPDIDGDLGMNRVMLAGKLSLSSDSK